MLRATLIEDEAQARALADDWDALAVDCGKPFSAPAWMLAWWRHLGPEGASLRIVAVRDDAKLVAVAPLYREAGGTYRLLGRGTSYRPDALVRPEHAAPAAAAAAEAIAERDRPDVVALEGVSFGDPWPRALAASWPGDAWLHRDRTTVAPVIELEGSTYEEWFASRNRRLREELRRRRRRLEEQGAVFRLAETTEERTRALEAFARLHYARWEERGGTKALDTGVEQLLADATAELSPARFRIWTIEANGEVISSHLFLAAGGQASYWLGGFDERWARFAPANLVIVEALRHCFESGDRRLDLGGGDQEYKRRLATGREELEWWSVVPRGPRYPLTRIRLAPRQAYRAVAARVPAETKAGLEQRWRAVRRKLGLP